MRLLAFDTSRDACAVAVDDGAGGPPVTATEDVGRAHGERLMGLVAETLGRAGLALADVERVGVAIGPGSFTGLRIGVAAARGLALVTGVPVAGISNLAVHAAKARALAGPVPVLVVTPAGRDAVYVQGFGADGAPLAEAMVAAPGEVAVPPGAVLAGAAAGQVSAGSAPVAHTDAAPDIAILCRLTAEVAPDGASPKPLYVRRPDVKPQVGAALPRAVTA